MARELTPEAEAERAEFEREDRGCACHISAPCGHCTHPGNPDNQEEDDSCWIIIPEVSGTLIQAFNPKTIGDFPADTKWLQLHGGGGAVALSPGNQVWLVRNGLVVELLPKPAIDAEVAG